VQELRFQLLDRRAVTLLQGAFLPSRGSLVFLLFNEVAGAVQLSGTDGSAGSLCTVGGRLPGICRVVECHLVEWLRFQLFDKGDWTLL
jgi:hypothetical protein